MNDTKKAKFKVSGIHCNGCASKIKNSISSLSHQTQVDVDVSTGEVTVIYDSQKNKLSDIRSKILDVGFSVEGMELE